MEFAEFFKKKRIDLSALEKAEPALFSEFKAHYEQMGEKSFDHTKKYWFNKTRRQFPLAVEIKTEKPHIANPLAEQTITESLTETQKKPDVPTPKTGFTPRFKAGAMAKPTDSAETPLATENKTEPEKPEVTAPKVGFTPRFRAGVTKPIEPVENAPFAENKTESEKPEAPAPKVGFTPRFKAGVTKPVGPVESAPVAENKIEPEKPEVTELKVGFTPRFKAGVTKPLEPSEEIPPAAEEEKKPQEKPVENTDVKPAYKPKFNMKNVPPKPTEE